jgi:hypothetical protein
MLRRGRQCSKLDLKDRCCVVMAPSSDFSIHFQKQIAVKIISANANVKQRIRRHETEQRATCSPCYLRCFASRTGTKYMQGQQSYPGALPPPRGYPAQHPPSAALPPQYQVRGGSTVAQKKNKIMKRRNMCTTICARALFASRSEILVNKATCARNVCCCTLATCAPQHVHLLSSLRVRSSL